MSESRREKIAAVLVTYNRKRLLGECLDSLLRQTRPLDGLYIIDNHSTDGTREYLQSRGMAGPPERESGAPAETVLAVAAPEFPGGSVEVHCVAMPTNTGGAGGFHEGLKRTVAAGFDWLWLMDDDLLTAPDALAVLVEKKNALEDARGKPFLLNSLVLDRDLADGERLAFPLQELSAAGSPRIGVYHWRLSEIRDQVDRRSLSMGVSLQWDVHPGPRHRGDRSAQPGVLHLGRREGLSLAGGPAVQPVYRRGQQGVPSAGPGCDIRLEAVLQRPQYDRRQQTSQAPHAAELQGDRLGHLAGPSPREVGIEAHAPGDPRRTGRDDSANGKTCIHDRTHHQSVVPVSVRMGHGGRLLSGRCPCGSVPAGCHPGSVRRGPERRGFLAGLLDVEPVRMPEQAARGDRVGPRDAPDGPAPPDGAACHACLRSDRPVAVCAAPGGPFPKLPDRPARARIEPCPVEKRAHHVHHAGHVRDPPVHDRHHRGQQCVLDRLRIRGHPPVLRTQLAALRLRAAVPARVPGHRPAEPGAKGSHDQHSVHGPGVPVHAPAVRHAPDHGGDMASDRAAGGPGRVVSADQPAAAEERGLRAGRAGRWRSSFPCTGISPRPSRRSPTIWSTATTRG